MSEQVTADQSAAGVDGCPKCFNEFGFAFGTCTECGWNYLDNTYHFITVWSPQDKNQIAEHDHNVMKRRSIRGTP